MKTQQANPTDDPRYLNRPLTREAARKADEELATFAGWFAPEARQEPHNMND